MAVPATFVAGDYSHASISEILPCAILANQLKVEASCGGHRIVPAQDNGLVASGSAVEGRVCFMSS